MPFLSSFMNEDSPCVPHSDIIWNAATELILILDTHTEGANHSKKIKEGALPTLELIFRRDTLSYLTLIRYAVHMVIET
jgi:hypothetical protein